MSGAPAIEITKVQMELTDPALAGAHIDSPQVGDSANSYALEIRGWAVGADGPVEKVEAVLGARQTALEASLGLSRPDVAGQFTDLPHAEQGGFRIAIGVLESRASFGIALRAKLADGSHARIGWIEGRRKPLSTSVEPTIEPLMINTIGRSGSTWLAWVLSCHPEIFGYRPLRFETRVATYWMSVLQALAQPRSYMGQLVTSNLENDRRWWLGDGMAMLPEIADPELESWLGSAAVEQTAAMCQGRIDAFFRQAAAAGGKPGALLFLEKFLLDPVVMDLLDEIYGGAREILLVRDFRDVVSSVLAFNAKRGFAAFGEERVANDADYVREVALHQADGMLARLADRGDRALVVRYEDLVLDPAPTLTRAFAYAGVDSSAAAVEATLERATSEASNMDHHRTVRDPAATIGRWREDLSAEAIAACDDVLGPALAAFGYAASDPASIAEAG